MTSYDWVTLVIVVVFWGAVYGVIRARHLPVRASRPAILAVTFLIAGVCINRYRMPMGTYAVAGIHLLLLPLLAKISRRVP